MRQEHQKRKPVAFNLLDPDEWEMYEHVKDRNFSGYVKRLIWNDMHGVTQTASAPEIEVDTDAVQAFI